MELLLLSQVALPSCLYEIVGDTDEFGYLVLTQIGDFGAIPLEQFWSLPKQFHFS